MKFRNALSKFIIIYWIVILCIAGFYSIESFYGFFRGDEKFNYRIILQLFTLAGILYLLANLIFGLRKKVEYSIPVLVITIKFSYLVGILGLTALFMHFSGLVKSSDAYSFGGACIILALCGYLSNLWFKSRYTVVHPEK